MPSSLYARAHLPRERIALSLAAAAAAEGQMMILLDSGDDTDAGDDGCDSGDDGCDGGDGTDADVNCGNGVDGSIGIVGLYYNY